MTELALARLSLKDGVYEATVAHMTEDALRFEAVVNGRVIATGTATRGTGRACVLRLELPARLIGAQVQIVDIRHETGAVLDRFSVVCDPQIAGDLRAELDMLRAEFDLLKSAFRRHCSETGAD